MPKRTSPDRQSAATPRVRSADLGPICQTCGQVPPKTPDISWDDWEQQRYCGPECVPAVARPLTRDELLEELGILAGTDTWANIAKRLGILPASLERRLVRMGELVWAREVQHELSPSREFRWERAA